MDFPFRLMLVTDRTLVGPGALPNVVDRAIAGGVDAVQLREKDLPADELIVLGRDLHAVTSGRALLLINGTAEQARACGADGVHLPEAAPMPDEEQRAGLLIGRSVHGVAAAQQAAAEQADYLVVGTIFPSRSHQDGQASGPGVIRTVTASLALPVVAIGGITAGNAADVIHVGASGVAVISAILGAPDPYAAAAELRAAVEGALLIQHPATAGGPR